MLELPSDPTPAVRPPVEDFVDVAPIVTSQQRESDFNLVFAWRGKEITYSVASELYYRELRTHMNAPAINSIKTEADFVPEACRVIYCASFDAAHLRALRLLPAAKQVAIYDEWVEEHVKFPELMETVKVANEINEATYRARFNPISTGGNVDGMGNSQSRP